MLLRRFFFTVGLALGLLPTALLAAFTPGSLGNVAFVGDSITHGYQTASYRYDVWKTWVDAGVQNNMVGVSSGNNAYTLSEAQKNYGGAYFNNVHSGGSSWRAYQTSGDYMNNGTKNGVGPGSIPSLGYMANWLGIEDSRTFDKVPGGKLAQGTYMNGTNVANYTGNVMNGANTPDTFIMMLGTNDLYSDANGVTPRYTNEQVFGWIKNSIDLARQANENANFVLLSMPNIDKRKGFAASVAADFNNYMKEQAALLTTEKSTILYVDTNKGVTNNEGFLDATMSGDQVHPNAQGNLIIGGNIAKGMGMAQRTVGLERKAGKSLASQTSFALGQGVGNLPVITTTTASGTVQTSWAGNGNMGLWTFADGQATINTNRVASSLSTNWNASTTWSFDMSLRIWDRNDTNNYFVVWCGNGIALDGFLSIYEDKITWGYNLNQKTLYVSDMTADFSDIRMAYILGDAANGVAEGYYVWLDGQLIGEALQGGVNNTRNNRLLLGAYTNAQNCYADLTNVGFDTQNAYASNLGMAIPEPSVSFLGAFACLGLLLRRRR